MHQSIISKDKQTAVVQPFVELHSDEVHEIINRPPAWLVRWGITLFFCLMLISIAGCWFVKYPDIVSTPFKITAQDAPHAVKWGVKGRLTQLCIKDGEHVEKGQILAVSESTADPSQVLDLGKNIENFRKSIVQTQQLSVNELLIGDFNRLGEIQKNFRYFEQKFAEFKSVLSGGYYLQKRKFLLDDVTDLKKLEADFTRRLGLQQQGSSLKSNQFSELTSSLIRNRYLQNERKKEILELDHSVQEIKYRFYWSLMTLEEAVEKWEQKYVVRAPLSGRVLFSTPWQQQQNFTAGQELLTIATQVENFLGFVEISQVNLGKVASGQKVFIKLNAYPDKEFGVVEGVLSNISLTPGKDGTYQGEVYFPQKLKIRMGRALVYRNGMIGQAEIVTADRSLIERFFK